MVANEIGDDDGRAARDALLTMNKDALSTSKRPVDVVACRLEVGFEIDSGLIEDLDAVAVEAVLFGERQPRRVENLNEMRDVMLDKQVLVLNGRERPDVETARDAALRRQDLVHGCAHRLHHLGGHIVETNHDEGVEGSEGLLELGLKSSTVCFPCFGGFK